MSSHRPAADARMLMVPLFGIYDLRLATAHLGYSRIDSGLERAKIEKGLPPIVQGRQMLQSFVDTLNAVADAVRI